MDYAYGLMALRAQNIHVTGRRNDPFKRVVIAFAGPPGSGKSTAAQEVVNRLNKGQAAPWALVLPMDGFHYPQSVLDRMPNRVEAYARRGADWTFDAPRLLSFIGRLRHSRTNSIDVIFAPGFDHALKDPTADAIEIGPNISLVILEGSWLLLDREPWKQISGLVDDTWFIDVEPILAETRIAKRHIQAGIEQDIISSLARADSNDMVNGGKIRSVLVPPRFRVQSIETGRNSATADATNVQAALSSLRTIPTAEKYSSLDAAMQSIEAV